jgi:histidinol-phosphate aminotransferase
MPRSIDELVRPLITTLKPYSSARDEFKSSGKEMVFLDANENPNPSDVHRYPDPHHLDLKQIVANTKGVAEDQVFIGNGSDEILDLLVRIFVEPYQDAIMYLPPTFGMYKVLGNLHGAHLIEIPLNEEWQPDETAILNVADERTKILFLCSPNNPTGQSLNRESVFHILDNFKGIVVIDEAYIDFADDPGFSKYLDYYKNLVITQTLSKAYGLAGIRLGICLANTEVIDYLKRIKMPYNVSILNQTRAKEVLLNPDKIDLEVRSIKLERANLAKLLSQISFVSYVFPSNSNFLLIRVDDAVKRYAQLLNNGIVVRNTSGYLNLENTLRISIGTAGENQKLIEVLDSLSKKSDL